VSRMCPATDRKKVQEDGHCRSAKSRVKRTFGPTRHAPQAARIRLLIRRLWVRVPPPERGQRPFSASAAIVCTAPVPPRGFIERGCEVVEVLVEQVTVDIQREARGTVSQCPLHVDRLPLRTDHSCRGTVTERVHPDDGQTQGPRVTEEEVNVPR